MTMTHSDAARAWVRDFARALKVARAGAYMNQSEVATELGVHATSVSQWERGDRADVPSREVVLTLDRVLNANGELLRACGYTPEEVLPVDVSPPATNATHSGRQIIVSLPGELETDDVMAILEVAHRMADARRAAAGN